MSLESALGSQSLQCPHIANAACAATSVLLCTPRLKDNRSPGYRPRRWRHKPPSYGGRSGKSQAADDKNSMSVIDIRSVLVGATVYTATKFDLVDARAAPHAPCAQPQGFPLFFLIFSYIYAPAIGPSEVRFPATATTSRLQGSLGVGSERLAGWGVVGSRRRGH